MNNKDIVIAFDTSNYTTSFSVATLDGEVIENLKLPLPVNDGERGLRQSEALFHHVNRLPDLLERYKKEGNIVAVGYSKSPRDVDGSYMPCFLAGKCVAITAAKMLNVPLYSFSHQNGHIMAALYSAERLDLIGEEFYAFHVSGGTTEVLKITPDEERVFSVEQIGGTLDLNAGQAIDRIGVHMGVKFPCGPELEKLALTYEGKADPFKISVKGTECNLSGLENKAVKLFDECGDKARVAKFVLCAVSKTLEKITQNMFELYGKLPVVYAGGVMSCSLIKDQLSKYGDFATPAFSSDNAAGCAVLTQRAYLKNKEN